MINAPTKPARRAKVSTEPPRHKRAARRLAAPTSTPAPGKLDISAELPPTATRATGPGGKLGIIVGLMRRPEGATVAQMSEATNWQAHSVRGALAGALKKKHGLIIASEAGERGRIYRIATEQPA